MKEGEILSLDSVASQLNVSAMPVREAFQILARDGLIQLRQLLLSEVGFPVLPGLSSPTPMRSSGRTETLSPSEMQRYVKK